MNFFFYLPAGLIFLVDQITKRLIAANLQPGQSVPLIKDFLHITYVRNSGAAFGILRGANGFLLGVGILVLALILYFYFSFARRDKIYQIILGIIFGAAVGNLIDRLRLGYVVDFIDFRFWPVFNFADTFINVGVAGWIVMLFWQRSRQVGPGAVGQCGVDSRVDRPEV